jgi:hypothetical protein
MGTIYSRASSVIIWLGEYDHETEMTLQFLKRLVHANNELFERPRHEREQLSIDMGLPAATRE